MTKEILAKEQLSTKRLILRPFELEDAEFIYQSYNDSLSIKFVGDRHIHSLKDAESYLKRTFLKAKGDYSYCLYVMLQKASLVAIGYCGLFYNTESEAIDFAFSCLKEHRGQSYVLEAVKAVLAEAQLNDDIDEIRAIVDSRNAASKHILEKNGFKYQSVIKQDSYEELVYLKTF